jgi:hypothetical protein
VDLLYGGTTWDVRTPVLITGGQHKKHWHAEGEGEM